MVTIKKRGGLFPIFFSSLVLLSSLVSCSFYLLDQRTISGVEIPEMTWKDGIVVLCPDYGHLTGLYKTHNKVYSRLKFLSNGKRLRKVHPEEFPLKGGIIALYIIIISLLRDNLSHIFLIGGVKIGSK